MSNNNNTNNNQQRTSPRFSNSTTSPQYFEVSANNYHGNNATLNMASFNDVNGTPTRAKKRNTSSRTFGPIEQTTLTFDPNNMQLYIQKLDLLYKNLEGRVQKLENIVADQFMITSNSPYTVVSRNSQTDNSGTVFNMTDFSLVSSSTSTSNTTLINSSAVPSVSNTIPSVGSTSTICSLLEPVQKEISKSDLDDYCLPLLQKRATPSIGELNAIVMNLKKLKYPDYDNKFILSKVREWFRRKREYMSQRIFNICSKKFGHLVNDPNAYADLCHKARNNPIFVGEIVREANLEILNEASAWEFCSEKISTYLENMTTSSGGNFQSQY